MAKRILSLLIAALLAFGLVPAAALAKISVPAPAGGSALDEALNVSGGSLGFTSEGDYPWQVITEDDRIYAQSGNEGVSSSESVLTMTCTVQSNMAIHFDYKARGEGTSNAWDKCIFMIDSNQVFAYGQVSDEWLEYTVNVAAGEHTFTWKYTKDSSVNAVGDYFALDNVRFEEREALPVNEELDAAVNAEGGSLHFYTTGEYPWTVVTDSDTGRVCGMSGNGGVNSSVSEMMTAVTLEAGGTITFDYMAWGEGTGGEVGLRSIWDHCRFYVDGTAVFDVGALNNEWTTFTYELTAGEHELKWSYQKDSSTHPEGDYFKVDNVAITENEPDPSVITSVAINGIVPPENGMVADQMVANYSVPEGANYAVAFIELYCYGFQDPISLSTVLEANGETDDYYLVIYFGANEGFAFDENFTATVNGGEIGVVDSWIQYNGNAAVKTENMSIAAASELIDTIEINGIVPPENGMVADQMVANYSVPEGANYAVAFIELYCYGFQDPISLSTVLEANGETDDYYLVIYFGANEGFAFDENFTATVNGGEIGVVDSWIQYNGNAAVKTENMSIAAASELIDTIEINGFVVPEWGAAPFYGVTVPEGAHYSIQMNVWTLFDSPNSTNTDMVEGDVYDHPGPDFNYYQRFMLVPDEGYAFPLPEFNQPGAGSLGELTVLINGSDELVGFYMVDYDESSETYGCLYIASASFTVEEPASNVITTIEIEGFTAPVYGEHPDYEVSVPEGVHYSVTTTNWNWFMDGFGNTVFPEDTFDNGDYSYYQYFEITADEGYTFAEDVTVTINGDGTLVDSHGENGSAGSQWINSIFFTIEAPEPNYITSVELNDFTVPAWGEHPDFDMSIPEGAHYSIDYVDWSFYGDGFGILTADDVFDNTAATYAMYIQLIPEEGWVLADDAVFTINGETALVDPMGCGFQGGSYPYIYVNTIGFTVEEPPAEPIAITEINVEGFVIPTAGMTGAEYIALTVPAGANYHIELINAFNQTTGNPLVNEDVLEAGSAYIVGARVSPNEGYYFAEDATLLANGGTELLNSEHSHIVDSENAWIVMIECTIPTEQEPVIIDTVYVNGFEVPPVEGENPFDHLNLVIPDGEPYTLDMSAWYNEDSFFLQTDAFEAGGHYSVAFQLIPNEGCAFAEEVTIILDGGEVGVSEFVYCYADHLLVYTIPYECEAAPHGIIGDVDLNGVVEVNDAILTLRYAMGLIDLTEEQLAQADVDGDGDYDLVDATLILRYAMDLIDHFPVEDTPIED